MTGIRRRHIAVLQLFPQKLNTVKFNILLLGLFLLSGCSTLQKLVRPTQYHTLDKPKLDGELQSKLEIIIDDLGLTQAVRDKRLSFAFADISDINHPIMAGVNETHMMYAASLPKIAILFGLFKKIEDGEIEWTDDIKKKAEDMNRASSNPAASELFKLVGSDYIRELMLSEKYGLYDVERYGGLWAGKEYSKAPAKNTDPIAGMFHTATPFSVLRFYYMLESVQLLSEKWTLVMRDVMSETAYKSKFVRGLQNCCPEAKTLRKAGAWKNFSCDSALVFNRKKKYILVGFADDPDGEIWLEKLPVYLNNIAKG